MSNRISTMLERTKESLVNDLYNRMVADMCDVKHDDKEPEVANGKRVPYIGWFWRSTDFVGKRISIGDANGGEGDEKEHYIGVMENNKWDYPERYMTEAEVDTFIAHLEKAFDAMSKGGILDNMIKERDATLSEMRQWFQGLTV